MPYDGNTRSRVKCYFLTGTGRCGTMLLSQILGTGTNTHCDHERSACYAKLRDAYLEEDYSVLNAEIQHVIEPLVKSHNDRGMSYGESSGLLYMMYEELYRRFGAAARFVLLVRRPEDFAPSALARGFFDPNHPYPLEHIRARKNTDIGMKWDTVTPFEKCLWYWREVNLIVMKFFSKIEAHLWRLVRVEDLSVESCRELFEFLGVQGFEAARVKSLLEVRLNATPGIATNAIENPRSQPRSVGGRETWTWEQNEAYRRWIDPIVRDFYP
jgi:hypothetical protein